MKTMNDDLEKFVIFFGDPVDRGVDMSQHPPLSKDRVYRMLKADYFGKEYVALREFYMLFSEDTKKQIMLSDFRTYLDTLVIPERYIRGLPGLPENYIQIGELRMEFSKEPFEGATQLRVQTPDGKQATLFVLRPGGPNGPR